MSHGRFVPARLVLPVLAITVGILTGCPRPGLDSTATKTLPQITVLAGGSAPAWNSEEGSEEAAVPMTFGVRWPVVGERAIHAMPLDTRAVTFYLSRNEEPVQTVTVIRDPASQTASKTVLLYPGDYTVRVRAYMADSPTDASPVVASGAQSFTVVSGQAQQTVSVTLTISPSPVPASPFPTPTSSTGSTPSPSPSPTQSSASPTPSPTPSNLSWALVSPGISFNDSYFVDFKTGWVVGSSGKVRKTTNGGVTWATQDVPGASTLNSVFFLDATTGWVGGSSGIYKSTDGGATWVALPPIKRWDSSDSESARGIVFTSPLQGLYAGSYGLYATIDGGQTWSGVAQGYYSWGFLSLAGVFGGAAFTSQGDANNDFTTFRYQDGGVTDVLQGKTLEFISNSASAPSTLMAAHRNELYTSSDGGMSWAKTSYQVVGVANTGLSRWGGLRMLSATHALGFKWIGSGWDEQSAAVVETTDGGTTWTVRAKPTVDYYNTRFTQPRFFAFDANHAWQAYQNYDRLLRIGSLSP